jgi:hypothetical protein
VISCNESWNTELQGFLDVQAMEGINEISPSLMEALSVAALFSFPFVCKGRLRSMVFSSTKNFPSHIVILYHRRSAPKYPWVPIYYLPFS